MKIKELQKTVNVTWSPAQHNPIMLAAGTAAQQLDATFNTNSTLEVYSVNLSDPGYDMELKGSQVSPFRFHKVIWSPAGGNHVNGLIVGGCEGGNIQVFSAEKLLAGEESLVSHQNKHNGPVRALDYNSFQTNLIASAASESEIYIWDLYNTTTPMTPGNKTQPYEEVQTVAWNKQVQHILASVFPSRCVIWDLRKNEPIMKLSDNQSRVRWRAIQWHPEVATQLWLASEDDQTPVVQLWDLRYATAPTKTAQIHQRGILSMTWCPQDTELMVSCGKDNKILCWNPKADNPADASLSEVATTLNWYSDILWCPRNPALVSASSLDGNVSVYSLLGGSQQQVQTSNKIADSFPGMDAFSQAPVPQQASQVVYSDLVRPPKWMKRPAGASFGFGGKLITFQNASPRTITINQVITETNLIERSNLLEAVLAQGNYEEFCRQKADKMTDQHKRYMWHFLKANFDANPRAEMLNLLGYQTEDMCAKFNKIVASKKTGDRSSGVGDDAVDQVTDQMAGLSRSDSSEVDGSQSTDDISTDLSGIDNNAIFDAIAAGQKLLNNKTTEKSENNFKIRTDEDKDGLICQALISGNIEAAVELCMDSGRYTDAIIIAMTNGSELLAQTQYRYLKNSEGQLSHIISAMVTKDWSGITSQCSIDSWKEALVAALTHSDANQFAMLCEQLGERLEREANGDTELSQNAILCYLCAGNFERIVNSWSHTSSSDSDGNESNEDLQNLVEVVVLLQKAAEHHGRNVELTGKLADLLSRYASLLAAQGSLQSALTYLGPSTDPDVEDLRDRLYYALGIKQVYKPPGIAKQLNTFGQMPQNTYGQRPSIPNNQAPTFMQPPVAVPKVPAMPPANQWAPINTPKANTMMAPADAGPMMPPPRPASVGQPAAMATGQRSKYIVDPSVQSTNSYGQTNNSIFSPPSQPAYGAPGMQQGNHQTQQFNQFNTQPIAPMTNQFNPPTGGQMSSYQQAAAPAATFMAPAGLAPIEVGQIAMQQPSRQLNPTPPSGWNDPPLLSSNRQQQMCGNDEYSKMYAEHAGTRKWRQMHKFPKSSTATLGHGELSPAQKSKTEFIPTSPITHPIFGSDATQQQNGYMPDQNLNPNQSQSQSGGYMQPQQMHPQQMQTPLGMQQPQPQQQQQQANLMQPQQMQPQQQFSNNQMGFQTNFSQMYQPQQQQQEAPAQPAQPPQPEPPKPKAPLPEEYIYMQTVFTELRTRCIATTNQPQTKRKLEDVAKRLESLYDILGERRLSQNTLTFLNQLVQYIQIGDYANALALHTHMVSGPDFSQIASFMPGIKVLVQSAMQMQVFLS